MVAATNFAGLLAPAAVAVAEPLPLTLAQPDEAKVTSTGSVPTSTGSVELSPQGLANLIEAFADRVGHV